MRRLAFVFRPGWIALGLVVVAFAYLCFTVLAPWQLGKNTKTTKENRQVEASLTAAPVTVSTLLPRQDSAAPEEQWRQVTATGRYLPDAEALVRLRVIDGAPAYEVLTAFAVDGGPVVLVNRGYARPLQGTDVPPIPAAPDDTVSITARLRDSETAPTGDKQPFTGSGRLQVYAIDTAQFATLTRTPVAGSYLQLVGDQPGGQQQGLGVLSLPKLDSGPFLSYGIQWIAFGILAPIGLGYFAFSEIRIRRREALQREATRARPEPVTVEEKLADRYGRRR